MKKKTISKKALPVLAVVAVAVVIAACDESPTAVGSMGDVPTAERAAAVDEAPIDLIYKETTGFAWVRRFLDPCLVEEPGEVVIFQGKGQATYARWRDAAGTLHHRFQWHIRSVTATGEISGETYRVSGSITGGQLEGEAADVIEAGSRFRITSPGEGGVFLEDAVHRFVFTPDGALVYEGTNGQSTTCVGNGG